VVPTQRNFYDASPEPVPRLFSVQKASPSKGLIRKILTRRPSPGVYKHYASAISVLCDEKYFQGSFDFLPMVSKVARSRFCVRTSPSIHTRFTWRATTRLTPAC
jgi:indole-3-glycerol phosphate synthase/phosphoribosylanthranilate isomerase